MALKTSKKDRRLNMVYSLGASIVIIGALFKINHWGIPFIGIGGTEILAVGLISEAIIFFIFAFDPPSGEYEWEKVYPELVDSNASAGKRPVTSELQLMEEKIISEKIDGLLKEALIDAELLRGLKESFEKFGDSVNELNQSSEHAKKVSQQLSNLQENLTSINDVYEGMLSAMNSKK